MAVDGLTVIRYRRQVPGSGDFRRDCSWVFVGNRAGLDRHRARRGSLVAPVDADPTTFRWPVEGLSVMLISDGAPFSQAARVAECMIRDGAELVVTIWMQGRTRIGSCYAYGPSHPKSIEARDVTA